MKIKALLTSLFLIGYIAVSFAQEHNSVFSIQDIIRPPLAVRYAI